MNDRFCQIGADFLGDFLARIEACVGRLSEEQVWWRPNPAANSVGNLILHLQGNLSQWILASLGGVAFERHRSEEFAAACGPDRKALLDGLHRVVGQCRDVIRRLPPEALRTPLKIQGYDSDGVHAVFHVVEHFSYHTGQIVYVTKLLLGPESGIEFFARHKGE